MPAIAESSALPYSSPMPHAPFVHLRVQSAYSMLEGAMSPEAIATGCRRLKMPAVVLADRNNMFAAMEFSDACKNAGIQPVIGALVAVERPGSRTPTNRMTCDWLVLLAQDKTGYDNLIAIVSEAHLGCDAADEPHLTLAGLTGRTEGLLALTAGPEGALARLMAEGQDVAAYADALVALFPGRLYVELSRTGEPVEAKAEAGLIALAHARGLPLVATNPVRFADASVHAAHDVMLCIADGAYVETSDRRRSNPNSWLKPADAMIELFADLPEACTNTLVVAQRCAYKAPARDPILPSLAGDPDAEGLALADAATLGLGRRLAAMGLTGEAARPYVDRLAFETDVIVRMGFAGYFLIVADFIQWAKQQDIPVGPGRGSGAGSVVAWALTITDLDPLFHGLLFERFLNPERVSMPDFDIDFCETRRGEVIRYVQSRYGRAQVAQIITFGKLKARAVLKDVGRVLQMPYGQIDRIAKMVPNHPTDPWTLARAINGVSELVAERERDPKVAHLLEIALKLEGLPRHSSTHAAGVVIGDRPLSQLVPMYRDPRSDMPVTQFDMKWVEKAGLVKFDFLGLKTLSVLQRALQMLKRRGLEVDLAALPLDDAETYQLIARGETVGVFQFESEGMRRALTSVRPDCFADIIALGALYRPGPMENIPAFGRRKNGEEAPDYLHASLEAVLKETYGVIIYQEQVMQIAQILAGYSLGEADLLRRAMGKKIKAEMDAQKARFADGAAKNGVDKRQAASIFELVNKFAGYGFNKSHAAAYALVSYHTAWLKTHHPVEFYAASMAYDITNTDRLAIFVDDMRRMGVKCLPPCINASAADFTVEGGAVRYALAALKGVGEKAMATLAEERGRGGRFASLAEFSKRVDPKLLNKRQLESLVAGGAFDGIEKNRAGVHALAETMLGTAQNAAAARESAQVAMFGDSTDRGLAMLVPPGMGWTLAQTMAQEKDAFGFYFSGHPVEGFAHVLEAHGVRTYAQVCAAEPPPGGGRLPCTMAGLIEDARWRTPQNGKSDKYLLLTMSDATGQYVASCFDEGAQGQILAAFEAADAVLVSGELLWRPGEETPRVTVRGVQPLAALAARSRCRLTVELGNASAIDGLRALLADARGGRGEVLARVPVGSGRLANIMLGLDFAIDGEMRGKVERLRGIEAVGLTAVS
ncbi:MAG: DNA polymerase III subunit alpha [Janthinobacterium lividum]